MRFWIAVALLAGTATAVAAAGYFATKAADAERQAEIAEANLAAMQDTVTLYNDSIQRTTSLMQFQMETNQDSILLLNTTLARAVYERNQNLRALNTLRVEFETLREQYESSTVTDIDTDPYTGDTEQPGAEQGTFEIAGPPIQGDIWVTYRPNLPWSLRTALTVTPFSQVYSVGCDAQNRAIVNITTPEWVRATPERGTISPEVCNPVKPRPILSFSWDRGIWGLAGVLLGGAVGYFIWHDSGPSWGHDSFDWSY